MPAKRLATRRVSSPARSTSPRQAPRPRTVDELIASAPADKRAALRAIRAAIRKAAPDAAEAVAYGGLAQYKHAGRVLLYFGYAKEHVALYGPIQLYLGRHPELRDRYVVRKGTLQLPPDRPVPVRLVAGVVRTRMDQIDSRA